MKSKTVVFSIITVMLLALQCSSPLDNASHKEEVAETILPDGAIPFQFRRHIVFTGHFNDSVTAKWVYDTGCPYEVVDSSFYVDNGYSYEGAIPAYTFGAGNGRTRTHILDSEHIIGLDTLAKHPSRIYLLDLRKAVGDKKADGILQVKYFRDATIEINYQDEYLLIHHDTFIPDSSWTRIPFEFTDDRRINLDAWVEIESGKKIEGTFLMDLGSGGSIGIASPAAKKINISKSSKNIRILDLQNGGIGGSSTVGLLEADACGIGPYSFANVPVMYSTNQRGALGSHSHNGIIGNLIMSRFHLIIDFSRSCIYIKPNENFFEPYKNREHFGLHILDRTITEGGFKVNGLIRKSRADSIGFKLGDLITHIDTIAFSPADEPEYFYQILDSLVLRGGFNFRILREEQEIKLSDRR